MTKVKCTVTSCSYNKECGCYAGPINIAGKGAGEESLTCCGSFLNQQHYSNLAEYTSMRGATETVLCNVNTCKHNAEQHCTLSEIEVGGRREASIYTETECTSFSKR